MDEEKLHMSKEQLLELHNSAYLSALQDIRTVIQAMIDKIKEANQ